MEVYGHDDTPVHDALAVAHVIDPTLLRTEHLNVELDVTQGPAAAGPSSTSSSGSAASRTRTSRSTSTPTRFIDLLTEQDRLAGMTEYPFERRLGAHPLRTGRTEFRVWAPEPERGRGCA